MNPVEIPEKDEEEFVDQMMRLLPYAIFVFGSNGAGIHGAGAAKTAYQKYDARWGRSHGPSGRTYAIATKKSNVTSPLALGNIEEQVKDFIQYAINHPENLFLVTKIGCGFAGYTPSEIGPFFDRSPDNCILPASFAKAIRI